MAEAMIERAALRMVDTLGDAVDPQKINRDLAVAAVRAVLTAIREPSEAMLKAAYGTYDPYEEHAFVEDVWPAMVDAALAEGE